MNEEEKRTMVIDPKKLKPGTCYIDSSFGEKYAVCKSNDGKIRIFKVIERKEE